LVGEVEAAGPCLVGEVEAAGPCLVGEEAADPGWPPLAGLGVTMGRSRPAARAERSESTVGPASPSGPSYLRIRVRVMVWARGGGDGGVDEREGAARE
jgi:hypothetical protein